MTKFNESTRKAIEKTGLPQWRVAYQIGISAQTLYLWLRTPLTDERQTKIDKALKELEKQGDESIA